MEHSFQLDLEVDLKHRYVYLMFRFRNTCKMDSGLLGCNFSLYYEALPIYITNCMVTSRCVDFYSCRMKFLFMFEL